MAASVSDVKYVGKDLDVDHLGGIITWDPPADTSRVVGYTVYLARSSAGGFYGDGRSMIGFAEPLLSTMTGTNLLAIYPDTDRLEYEWMVVYTKSSLVEQTTPTSLRFFDTTSMAQNLSFTDNDLDFTEIGGTLYWDEPEEASRVTHYLLYFAMNHSGFNRSFITNVSVGTNELFLEINTPISFERVQGSVVCIPHAFLGVHQINFGRGNDTCSPGNCGFRLQCDVPDIP